MTLVSNSKEAALYLRNQNAVLTFKNAIACFVQKRAFNYNNRDLVVTVGVGEKRVWSDLYIKRCRFPGFLLFTFSFSFSFFFGFFDLVIFDGRWLLT